MIELQRSLLSKTNYRSTNKNITAKVPHFGVSTLLSIEVGVAEEENKKTIEGQTLCNLASRVYNDRNWSLGDFFTAKAICAVEILQRRGRQLGTTPSIDCDHSHLLTEATAL